jgi:hypothetical protein
MSDGGRYRSYETGVDIMRNNVGRWGRLIPGNNVLHGSRMRKRLAAAAAAAAISVSGILVASAPAALAESTSCYYSGTQSFTCVVWEDTADGLGWAGATFNGATGDSVASFVNTSGFSMYAWVNIDYGNGYETVWSTTLSNEENARAGPFDDSGYLTEACFQFTGSGAAVHCTPEGV